MAGATAEEHTRTYAYLTCIEAAMMVKKNVDLLTVGVERQRHGFLQTLVVDDALDARVTEQPRLEVQRARHHRRAVALIVRRRHRRPQRAVVVADVPRYFRRWSGLGGAVDLCDS